MATLSGASIAISDVLIPGEKVIFSKKLKLKLMISKINLTDIFLTDGERYNKVIDVWTQRFKHVCVQ